MADYIAGAKLFRRFAPLSKRYSGREVVLRIRMDGQFGTWKMKDEFFTAFGFDSGDTLFGNDATVIGINMNDLDERARTIDFLQEVKMQTGFLITKLRREPLVNGNLNLHMSKLMVLYQEVMVILQQILQR